MPNAVRKVKTITKASQEDAISQPMNPKKERPQKVSIIILSIFVVVVAVVATIFLAVVFSIFSRRMVLFVGDNNFSQTGLWKLTGHQLFVNNLEANMVIDVAKKNNFSGYFDWSADVDLLIFKDSVYGREYFFGQFDSNSNKIFLHGIKLENSNNLSLGRYEAYFDKENSIFYDGISSDGGTWQAAFIRPLSSFSVIFSIFSKIFPFTIIIIIFALMVIIGKFKKGIM